MNLTEKTKKPVVLVVLDGWGYREETKDNAIAAAKKPNWDKLWDQYPHALLEASGPAVGLPEGQMGNSEVGHTIIGAGKIIDTDLVRIDKAIGSGELAKNPVLTPLFEHVKKNNSTLHLMGLLGPGGVHAHSNHLDAILRAAKEAGVERVAIHAFTDGRDTPPQSAAGYLRDLEEKIKELGLGQIATVTGRYYAMDRDSNWDRLEKFLAAAFHDQGELSSEAPSEYLEKLYAEKKQLDEHLPPVIFPGPTGAPLTIRNNDAVFMWNYRPDRARMLAKKLTEKKSELDLALGIMTDYGDGLAESCLVAFPPSKIETTLAAEIAKAGLTQAHIAETEKFAHATYFLNGGEEKLHAGEKDILLDSRKDVATHDLAPKMRAEAITDKAVGEINAGTDFIFINYANADMVGHTANVPAIIEAIEELDKELGRLLEAVEQKGGIMLVTADHGNAEINVDPETGAKHTAHTTNPVPAILSDKNCKLNNGTLADIAPTVLSLLNLPAPKEMTGKNLLA